MHTAQITLRGLLAAESDPERRQQLMSELVDTRTAIAELERTYNLSAADDPAAAEDADRVDGVVDDAETDAAGTDMGDIAAGADDDGADGEVDDGGVDDVEAGAAAGEDGTAVTDGAAETAAAEEPDSAMGGDADETDGGEADPGETTDDGSISEVDELLAALLPDDDPDRPVIPTREGDGEAPTLPQPGPRALRAFLLALVVAALLAALAVLAFGSADNDPETMAEPAVASAPVIERGGAPTPPDPDGSDHPAASGIGTGRARGR
ncbi:MAG: hypothetical protein AAFN30_05190 [Actinomycetota bacterium]